MIFFYYVNKKKSILCIKINNVWLEWKQDIVLSQFIHICIWYWTHKKKKTENTRILTYFLKTRDVALNYHRNKEPQLYSWKNNVLEFWTSPEGFPGTNWSLLAKQSQQRQELFWKLCVSQNSHWEIRFFNTLWRIFHKKSICSQIWSVFQCCKQEFRQLFFLSVLSSGLSGSSGYPCFRLWIYTLWEGITALTQS